MFNVLHEEKKYAYSGSSQLSMENLSLGNSYMVVRFTVPKTLICICKHNLH